MTFFGKIYLSDHVKERYVERIGETEYQLTQKIKSDLYYKRVKRIVNIGKDKHIFTQYGREYVFEKIHGDRYLLKTIIKRPRRAVDGRIKRLESRVS